MRRGKWAPAPGMREAGTQEQRQADSESLDTYIQNTLSSLYPPFEATAATVLWQLFSIVEKFYRGDGLRCLIDFLVPAKRVLQCIQQETCGNYTGLIFYHEGWPLCIHEKVVVQLAPLHKVRLKPGDFYFQIVPVGKQSVRLVLKCLSRHGQGMEEIIVPETMYGYIFTAEFLENVNCDRDGCPLESCLLTTGPATYRTPWKNIVNPIFIPTAETILQNYSGNSLLEKLILNNPDAQAMAQTMESSSSRESSTSNDTGSTMIEVPLADSHGHQSSDDSVVCHGPESQAEVESSDTSAEDGKGDEPNPRALSDGYPPTDPISGQATGEPEKTPELTQDFLEADASSPPLVKRNGARSITFGTDLSSPRQRGRDSVYFETKRLFRKSYIEALQNPMNLGSSSEESIAEEEHSGHIMDSGEAGSDSRSKICGNCVKQESSSGGVLARGDEPKEGIRFGDHSQGSEEFFVPHEASSMSGCRSDARRSRSLDRTLKSSRSKEHQPRASSDGMFGANPKRLLNGHSVKQEKLDSRFHELNSSENQKSSLEDEALSPDPARDSRISFRSCESAVNVTPLLLRRENELWANCGDPDCVFPSQFLEANQELLQLGIITLCGNRDRGGRAVLQACIKNGVWSSEHSGVQELTQLLMYLYSIPRKEVRALGLLVLVDARKSQNVPVFFKALAALQGAIPHSVHSVLILTDKDSTFKPDKEVAFQCDVLTSLKALLRYIDCTQLTADFDGIFPYNHNDWIRFRRKLEPFVTNCQEAIVFLQYSVCSLNNTPTPVTAQEANDLIHKHKTMMKLVLEDELLVTLRLEGGTMLARLRKEEFCNTDDYRDAMETATRLYNQVDEEVHRLVLLSNKCLQQLENFLAMRKFEEGCDQIKAWFENESEKYLSPLDQEQLSLETVKTKQEEFQGFHDRAMQYSQKGLQLIKENSALNSEEEFQSFSRYLNNITVQTEKRRRELEKLITLYEFYETAHKWMVHCNEYLEHLSAEAKYSPSAIRCLQSYHQEAAKVSAENFQRVNEVILALGSKEELKRWNILWLKCQQAKHHLEEVLSEALKGSSGEETSRTLQEAGQRASHSLGSGSGTQHCPAASADDSSLWDTKSLCTFQQGSLPVGASPFVNQRDATQSTEAFPPVNPSQSQGQTPLFSRFRRTSRASEDLDNISTCYSEPVQMPTTRHRKHPLKKIMKKTQSFELTRHESSSHCEQHHPGYTGVYIRGLEVASNIAAERRHTQRSSIKSPLVGRNRSLSSPSRIHHMAEGEEKKRAGR